MNTYELHTYIVMVLLNISKYTFWICICNHKTHIRTHQIFYSVLTINSFMKLTMCYNYQAVCSRTLQYLLMFSREYMGLNFILNF